MTTHHERNRQHTTGPRISAGMMVMGTMMGLCLGGTVLAAAVPALGLAAALVPAIFVGIAFVAVSLRYNWLMSPLMAVCCGAAVFVNAVSDFGLAGAGLLALAVGAVIGLGSQKLMGHMH
jgi:hypothetical protein